MKLIRTRLEGMPFFYKKGDKTIGERIALRKYEWFETYLIKNLSISPGMAVDVGANIGYYSLILSKLVERVVAFEPEPINFGLLKKNLQENAVVNVLAVEKAVSDTTSQLILGLSKGNLGDHQINSIEKGREKITIKSTTLDKAIKDRVSILKIDTQGWEPKVVAGAKGIIKRDKPTIFMEFWPTGYKRSALDYGKMLDYLKQEYGRIYLMDDELGLVYPVSLESLEKRCKTEKGYVDLLFKEKLTWRDRWLLVKRFRFKKFLKKVLYR